MEEVKRIYILLLHGNGLKIKDIAKELDLDKYYVADILFSTDNIPFWYQDSSSLWFAKEGAIVIDEPEEEQSKAPIVVPKVINTDRFLKGHTSAALLSHLSHLSQYRIYSDNELAELFRRYREGDIKARELIVKSQQKLVAGIAVLYTKYGIPLEDLIQEGNIGLIRAIERFDYHRFRSFHNFAKSWILQAISASMATLPYMVRLPLNQLALYRKVRKFKEKYEQQNGCLPSVNDIEIDDNTDYETIAFLDKLPDSLKELATLSENLDIYESNDLRPDAFQEKEYKHYLVKRLMRCLDSRSQQILTKYFGLDGNREGETLNAIGDYLGLTRERVRQIVEKTIRQLRDLSGIKREEAKLGDLIRLDSSEQVGRVVKVKKAVNGSTILVLKMGSGEMEEVSANDYSYEILRKTIIKKQQNDPPPAIVIQAKKKKTTIQKNISQPNSDVQREVTELDGVKVGDRIVYNGKNCTICKIMTRASSSLFYVKYDDGILDLVPNKKNLYRKTEGRPASALPQSKSDNSEIKAEVSMRKKSKEAKVGDRIRYDYQLCTVIEVKTIRNSLRLVIKYDDGTIDNVQDDRNRYRVVSRGDGVSANFLQTQIEDQEVLHVGDVIIYNGYTCSVINMKWDGYIHKYFIKYPDGSINFITSKSKYKKIMSEGEIIQKDNNRKKSKGRELLYGNYSTINYNNHARQNKAKVGDWIIRTSDNLIGQVIDIIKLNNGVERLILELKDGSQASVLNNTLLYYVLL